MYYFGWSTLAEPSFTFSFRLQVSSLCYYCGLISLSQQNADARIWMKSCSILFQVWDQWVNLYMKQFRYWMEELPCGLKLAKSIYFKRFSKTRSSEVVSQELCGPQ